MNGEEALEVTALLRENGYETYAASVGPVSSAWDRACELYAQLTGSVVDYGEAHSKAHNHERYGKSFEGNLLMGKEWDMNQPINLVGHSFGAPTSRLFASLMTYGDEAEIAASGSDVSPLFSGGHSKAVHSVTTLFDVHNGSLIANMLYDYTPTMYAIGLIVNVMSRFGSNGALGDFNLGHFGLTAKQGEDKTRLSIVNIIRFVNPEDNARYDLTLRGSKELNERIRLFPDTYYYSHSSYITEKNCLGHQKNTYKITANVEFGSESCV